MLKLRRIELIGFKSFSDRGEITVHDTGVTAIVGPNGCGKSNVSDAVAWVLGEQSAKSLRGDKMEDVIFNGTRNRAPMGMAEVTITLTEILNGNGNGNGNGSSPAASTEASPYRASRRRPLLEGEAKDVVVQRRLYRSGESVYLIDGKPCRLRDIQEIFLGTGLGPNSYAIIEQGRIGQLLSSKPSDRRTLIEEAAGITKFKAKRKFAESRLEAASQNLSRVTDILAEVERLQDQMTSLEERRRSLTADRARAAEELDNNSRERERKTLQLTGIEADKDIVEVHLNQTAAGLNDLSERRTAEERVIEHLRHQPFESVAR